MCLEIKRICWENPRTPIRKYPQILMSLFEESKPIPKWPTIEKFLLENDLKHKVLLKKALIRPLNLRKRLNFALENVEKDDIFFTT
jgi:hypothetical protein